MRKHLSFVTIFCLISSVLFLTYCSHGIKIFVDRPEVFTKERLIKQRLQERQWLEGKLKEKFVQGYQGIQDVREFKGLLADFQGVYDPASKLTAERIEADRMQIIRDKNLAELQHQVDMRRLQKQLENPPEDTGEQDETTPAATTQQDFYKGVNPSHKNDNYPALLDPSDIETTQAKLTNLESLRDEKAYRDAVQAMIRETDLDDSHDLYGNTLYTLKFDVSVFPKSDYASYYNLGKVNIKLAPVPLSGEEYFSLYNEWRKSLDKEIRLEALYFQRRVDLNMLTEHEKIELYVQASNLLYEKDKEFTDIEDEIKKEKQKENISRKIAILRKFLEATDYKVFFEEKKNKRVIYQVINILVETRYNVLKDIVKIENKKLLKDDVGLLKVQTKSWDNLPKEKKIEKELEIMKKLKAIEEMKDIDLEKRSVEDIIKNEAGGFFTGGESLLINRFLRFFINIKKLEKKKSTYIYTVEPKEYAQNISQVQAAEKLKNLVLSLKAILPSKGAKVGSYLNHLKRSQMKMNSILRKPLVVGYIDGRQKFGWFLGPRFQLNREKNVNFEHTPVQYSLQASIVTPGWHKEIELTGTYKWDNYGNTPLWKKKGLCKKKDTIRALLPGDMSSLTKALMNLYGGKHRQPPYIIPGRGSSTILLEAERTEYVLIKGKRLWRNPEVFIGSQKANNIEILPDMQGLLATFDKVQMPVKPWGVGPKVDPKVDLTVITSNGSATLSKVVAIREAPKKKPVSKPKTKAKITNIQAYKSGNFTLSIPAKSIPEKAAAIQLLVKPKGSKDWKVLKTGGHTFGPKKEKITFKEIDYKEGNAELSAELQYKDKKSSSFISIPVVGGVDDSFIYFTSEELFKATLTPLEITCTKTGPTGKKVDWIKNNILISFFNPTLFLKATPGLQEAIDGGFELLLSLDKDDKDGNASGILKIEKEKGHFKYTKKGKTGTIKIISSKLESTEIDGIDWIVNKFDDTITKKYFYLQIELPNRKQLDLKKRKLTIEFKK